LTISLTQLRSKVAGQRVLVPSLYGDVDFSTIPERFTEEQSAESALRETPFNQRATLLADTELVERIRAFTMLGDSIADAYAALIPEYGFRRLVAMLADACDRGVEHVEGAPNELVEFIREMEHIPDWLDMKLVERGARVNRNMAANVAPFAVRGFFVATFLNKYAALPMALTGTLSNETAARRIRETASFFTVTVLPGALERQGPGFKAAAMVRLMHSMVRFNALKRSSRWDTAVYGIPIPQVDQMPAGLISIYQLSLRVLRKGRTEFIPNERALVELSRYRCYLLGLPEELLADTPQGIVKVLSTRNATLRKAYDDETCGALLRATMAAHLPTDGSTRSRVVNAFERSFAKSVFIRVVLSGDKEEAGRIGLILSRRDRLQASAVLLLVVLRMGAYSLASRIPGVGSIADRILVGRLRKLLEGYGHAEYTTDASAYRSAKP
jgi:hypothetical protein